MPASHLGSCGCLKGWKTYPFSVPAIRFFAGENGAGKSTLLETIAAHYGFGVEGGTRNFRNSSTDGNYSTDALQKALRISFDKRTGAG